MAAYRDVFFKCGGKLYELSEISGDYVWCNHNISITREQDSSFQCLQETECGLTR